MKSYIIIVLSILLILIVSLSKFIFGDYIFALGDGVLQYYQFYIELINSKISLWNWNYGLGINYIGSIIYYIGSPILLAWVLVYKSIDFLDPTKIMILIYITKAILAGIVMYKYLTYMKISNFTSILVSVAYPFSTFATIYSYHIMWLDIIIILPLILYAIERFLKENKLLLLVIVIPISFVTQYYLFYSLTIFLFTYIIIKLIISNHKNKLKKFTNILIIYFFSMGIASLFIFPVISLISQSTRSLEIFSIKLEFNIQNILESYLSFFFGYDYGFKTQMFYTSILTILVLPYVIIKKSNFSKLILILMLIFSIGSMFSFFNFIIDGFNVPYNFEFRWSYIFAFLGFVILAIGLDEIFKNKKYKNFDFYYLFVSILFFISLLYFNINSINVLWKEPLFLFNLIFLLFYYISLKINSKIIIIIIIVIEILLSIFIRSNSYISANEEGGNHHIYNQYFEKESFTYYFPNIEEELYRISFDFNEYKNVNLGTLFSVPSNQIFISLNTIGFSEFAQSQNMHYSNSGNYIGQENADISLDTIQGIKYYITTEENILLPYGYNYLQTIYTHYNTYYIYENTNYIGMAYTYSYYITEEEYEKLSNNEKRAILLEAVVLEEENIELNHYNINDLDYIKIEDYSINSNCNLNYNEEKNTYEFIVEDVVCDLIIDINQNISGEILFDLSYSKDRNSHDLIQFEIKTEENLYKINTYSISANRSQVIDLGYVDEYIEYIKITFNKVGEYEVKINEIGYYDPSFNLVGYNASSINNKFIIDEEIQEGYLVTSIPYDYGWYFKDDKFIKKNNVNNGFIGFYVNEETHIYGLYIPRGLIIGLIGTIISIIIISLILYKNKKNKFSL